jgi:Uncharacterised ArCR, COG2043
MESQYVNHFIRQWNKYFPSAELPIAYFYTDQVDDEVGRPAQVIDRCLIGNLKWVRQGFQFVYDVHTPGCSGGKRYSGFSRSLRPKFEYFLSCGIPGELEGERYKRDPDLVKDYLMQHPPFEAPGKFLVFKRWDKLVEEDEPLAVIFFATGDVLSGLFTLANYDFADPDGVITPMGAGCGSIIGYPFEQSMLEHPRCVLGMFDVSARPKVGRDELTFTIPYQRFTKMVSYMDESFLITNSWEKVRSRLG